jgi:hypothetical protein
MARKTIHVCENCEYYQEPHDDYPERCMFECHVCNEYFCDDCHEEHAMQECFD